MSQESKIDDLRIRLAKAFTWLDIPGVSTEQLSTLAQRSYRLQSTSNDVEHSLMCGLTRAAQALGHIQLAPVDYPVHEHIHNLQFGVNTIESCLKVISPSRIDAISNDLK